MTVLTEDAYAQALREEGQKLEGAKAVVVVSAHGQSAGAARVSASPQPKLIYDFGGFPDALYRFRYPCPGSPKLAHEVVARLGQAGVKAELDAEAGLDHGVWVPLARLFPEADVPVVQIAMPHGARPEELLAMGHALAPLREEGVLLLGSGGLVHNLRALRWDAQEGAAEGWAQAFVDWVDEKLETRDVAALQDFAHRAPESLRAHPTDEHFLPLFFPLGAWAAGEKVASFADGMQYGSLSLRSFRLG
jgi:4,5-DOPA dioxygenase extradiol